MNRYEKHMKEEKERPTFIALIACRLGRFVMMRGDESLVSSVGAAFYGAGMLQ